MKKKLVFYVALMLTSVMSFAADARRTSDHPGVRPWVTGFVQNQMGNLFTNSERRFAAQYIVYRRGNGVLVRRVPSAVSVQSTQATERFNSAVEAIIHHILDVYDDNGFAERIDMFNTTDSNAFYFLPIFLGSMTSSSEEEGGDDDDNNDEDINEDIEEDETKDYRFTGFPGGDADSAAVVS